jgi:hypothetical protein
MFKRVSTGVANYSTTCCIKPQTCIRCKNYIHTSSLSLGYQKFSKMLCILNLFKLCNQSKINYEVDSLLLHKKIWTLCTWILHHSKPELWTRKPLSAILLFGRTATAMEPLRTWVCESVSVSWHCHSYHIMILTPVYKVMKILCPLVEASKCTHQVDNTLQNCIWQEVVRGESGAS